MSRFVVPDILKHLTETELAKRDKKYTPQEANDLQAWIRDAESHNEGSACSLFYRAQGPGPPFPRL